MIKLIKYNTEGNMKKSLVMMLVLVPVLCFAAEKSAVEKMFDTMNFKSASWTQKTVTVSDEGTDTTEQTVFYKDKKLASEGSMKGSDGKKTAMKIITTPKETIMIDLNKKEAMRMGTDSDFNPDKMVYEIYKHRDSAKKTGSEKANGVSCDIYEYSYTMTLGAKINFKVKEWREKGGGFVIRSVTVTDPYTISMMGFEKKAGKTTTTTDVLNLKKNTSVDEAKFSVPSGVKVQEMGSMKDMMKQAKPDGTKKASKKESIEEEVDEDSDADDKAAEEMMKKMMKGMMGR